MDMNVISVENPDTYEIIIGQGNFSIKTVEDLHYALKSAVPNIEFGVAMNEAKPQLTRVEGNEKELKELASKTCKAIGAGHVFVVYMKNAFPIHVINSIISIPGVVHLYVATSNSLEVLTVTTKLGKAIVGVVDGATAKTIETNTQKQERKKLLKGLGFTIES